MIKHYYSDKLHISYLYECQIMLTDYKYTQPTAYQSLLFLTSNHLFE